MSIQAREWIENSVHAAEQYRTGGPSQSVAELSSRCIEAAKAQTLLKPDIQLEIGDRYIKGKLGNANQAERQRKFWNE